MPISGTRHLMTGGGWATPSFDIKEPALYIPLWHPDMVAKGGTIVNGTGICTGSPLYLAVGANTVTVTQAGNFTVTMPEGGTVASGTMTVTASPVTIPAGIPTTVTTTGATGNITCTVSNIIRSKDTGNIPFTVTNGVFGKYGWTVAGAEKLIYTVANWRSSDSAGTILAWIKCTDTADQRCIFSSSDTAGAINYFYWRVQPTTGILAVAQRNADTNDILTASTNVGNSAWHCVALISSGTAYSMIVDGSLETLSVVAGANTGDWMADTTGRDNVVIGALVRNTTEYAFVGTLGATYYTPLVYTMGDYDRFRQRTQWRYTS